MAGSKGQWMHVFGSTVNHLALNGVAMCGFAEYNLGSWLAEARPESLMNEVERRCKKCEKYES